MKKSLPKDGYLVKISYWDSDNKLIRTDYKGPTTGGQFYSRISTARSSCRIDKDRIDKSEVRGDQTVTYTIIKANITWESMK